MFYSLTFNKYINPPQKEKYDCNLRYLKTRSDDNENTIKKRLEVYKEKTLPILDFYKERKLLHHVNGMLEIEQIFGKISGIIASLET